MQTGLKEIKNQQREFIAWLKESKYWKPIIEEFPILETTESYLTIFNFLCESVSLKSMVVLVENYKEENGQ
jgi:hypothetical protein